VANLLHAAHQVDGIVKGLKQPDWPANGWQALHRLAMDLCNQCAVLPDSRAARAGTAIGGAPSGRFS